VEEGNLTMGWGAEVVSRIVETSASRPILFRRLAAKDYPVPASPVLESAYFPVEADIVRAALQMTGKQKE
jgi:2-oxoisovalerate dehydrogenase E1 component